MLDSKGYAHNFFSFTQDFNGDGRLDLLVIGFPGRDSRWFENRNGAAGHWPVHQAMAQTDNESPSVQDLTDDSKPEIICQVNGVLGYASPNPDKPTEPFVWHAIYPEGALGGKFTHGLGVGDVKGGRAEWRCGVHCERSERCWRGRRCATFVTVCDQAGRTLSAT